MSGEKDLVDRMLSEAIQAAINEWEGPNEQTVFTVYAQRWMFRDSWSQPDEDGAYLYLNPTIAKIHTSEIISRYPAQVPECYRSPEGDVYPVEITDPEQYKEIERLAAVNGGVQIYKWPEKTKAEGTR